MAASRVVMVTSSHRQETAASSVGPTPSPHRTSQFGPCLQELVLAPQPAVARSTDSSEPECAGMPRVAIPPALLAVPTSRAWWPSVWPNGGTDEA